MIKRIIIVGACTAAILGMAAGPAKADSPTRSTTIRMTVAPQKVDCMGVAPMRCLNVKRGPRAPWTPLYGDIKGFDYLPGRTWVLDVRELAVHGPEADRSAVEYRLVRVVRSIRS